MKKAVMIISLVSLLMMGICIDDVLASSKKNQPSDNYLTFSFVIYPVSVGYKRQVVHGFYFTGNVDYVGSNEDLYFQGGAAYMIPRKFWIFWFYGGGGWQFSRNHGYQFPYMTLGTRVWFLSWEVVYPLQRGEETGYRFGFSFAF
ncbi:MAG: hypothetical protein KAT01_07350 [Candidatus Aminicenantes bacterium]|jgi:hypothetical protein|nr:hypothetical protein [Candidatus Aminicenantes bacterium]